MTAQESLESQFEGFIKTPQIFAENDIFEYPLFETKAKVSPEFLPGLTEPSTGVLGKRMEHFFSYYVENFAREEVLAKNEQIIQQNLTLGEFDFLLKNSISGAFTHVELIFKFYLYAPIPGKSELECLIGPNRRDSLIRKLQRLERKQFPLIFSEAAKPLLDKIPVLPEEFCQKACFKANIFVPLPEENFCFETINQECIAGFYIQKKYFTESSFGDSLFYSPPKPEWPVLPGQNKTWLSYSRIQKQILPLLSAKRSPLLWMKTPTGQYKRFFLIWW